MKVIVAGCGFVGEALRLRLLASGHEVVGVTLSPSDGIEACDISDLAAVGALASRIGAVNAIVHCAASGRGGDRPARYRAVYLDGCENLLRAFPSARLIFTSSSSVYGQTDGSLVSEESTAVPDAATGTILRAAEEVTLGSGGVVARLAGIYGPGRSYLLRRFLEGAASIDGRWINQIHREDAASGLAFLLEQRDIEGIFNIADDTPLWQADCYAELSKRFALPMPPEAEPDPLRRRGWTNKRVSNAKLRSLGWEPKFPSYFAALDDDPELVASIR